MHRRRIRIDTDFHRKNTDSPQEIVACLRYGSKFASTLPGQPCITMSLTRDKTGSLIVADPISFAVIGKSFVYVK